MYNVEWIAIRGRENSRKIIVYQIVELIFIDLTNLSTVNHAHCLFHESQKIRSHWHVYKLSYLLIEHINATKVLLFTELCKKILE